LPRGKYKAPINPILKNLIEQHVDAIEPEKFKAIGEKMLEAARSKRARAAGDHEKYIGEVIAAVEEAAGTLIIHPLLALIDKPIDVIYSDCIAKISRGDCRIPRVVSSIIRQKGSGRVLDPFESSR
jgi:hypothetical protein